MLKTQPRISLYSAEIQIRCPHITIFPYYYRSPTSSSGKKIVDIWICLKEKGKKSSKHTDNDEYIHRKYYLDILGRVPFST